MNIFNVVVWISLFLEVTGENYYISSHYATDWKTATKQCKLAEPELIYSSDGVTVNMQNVPATVTTEDVWIGYYIARTALEYFGCAKVDSYMPTYSTKADPGQCLSACGVDKLIGISGNKCFCFNKGENIGNGSTLFPNCDETCSDISDIICGKSDDVTSFMSLYRSIGPHVSSIGNQLTYRRCMYYMYNSDEFEWGACYTSLKIICEKDNITWTSSGNEVWKDATRTCFKARKIPSSYKNTQSVSAPHAYLWTGIVRSHVIYKYSTYQSLSKYAEKYVYIGHNDGDPVVKATRSSSSFTRNKLLCLNETTTNSLTTTTTLTHVTTTETKTNETSPGSLQVSTDSNNMTHSLLKANQKGSSNISIIVGASSSAVTVIVIVIVIIVILRRRGNKEKQPPHQMSVHDNQAYAMSAMSATHQNQQNTHSQEEYADIDMATSAAADESESDYTHDYFVLEKMANNTYDSTKDVGVKHGAKSALTPYSNSGYENGPYDTTEGVNQKPDKSGFNPYNHLGGIEEETSDYDHIGKDRSGHTASKKGVDDDNTYDTTDLGFLKASAGASDNIYNVTGENDSDDTYSHISGRKRHQTGLRISENDYDTFKK